MKCLFTILSLVILWPVLGQDYYKRAFENIIVTSDTFKESNCYCNGHFMIMEEMVPFDEISYMFSDKLINTGDSVKQKETIPSVEANFGKKRSKHKVFFSEERNGVFFAEIFCDANKKPTSFKMISSFGISLVYMFKANQNGSIELIDQKEISSN